MSAVALPSVETPAIDTKITSRAELDTLVAGLQDRAADWLAVPLPRKIAYVESMIEGVAAVAPRMVAAAVEAKGMEPGDPRAAEDWIAGAVVILRTLRILKTTMEQIDATGRVGIEPHQVHTRPDGQLVVDVMPEGAYDRILYNGFTAEVWQQPHVTRLNLDAHTGGVLTKPETAEPAVSLVLGAGNVASIGPLDVMTKLFHEGHVCLLKWNPVNDYLGPLFAEAFADLIRDGFLQMTYGGADVGAYLVEHPGIDEVHITGSARTHDVIVFGPGEEGATRKAENRPRLQKRITSELGNVTPIIIMPGDWNRADLQFHAENVATMMTQNGGFNCNAAKVLVTHADWPQREAFLDRLRGVLRSLEGRPAYYPGALDRFRQFVDTYPDANLLGPGAVPPTLIVDVETDAASQLAFEMEAFCQVTAEVALTGHGPAGFLKRAVAFCNERLMGTLAAGLIVDDATRGTLDLEARYTVEDAIADLRYGGVSLNHWPGVCYGLGSTPWGAFPGHTLADIQSGIGMVHNAKLFDAAQKSVVRGPFRYLPKPPWFVTHAHAAEVGERLVDFEADPNPAKLPGIFAFAVRG
ncbi:MAG: aldehyde dehydrogenase family protein [Bacteroidota bacterium]